MFAEAVQLLRCPRCAGSVVLGGRVLRCGAGHAFDLARQGYVNLVTGTRAPAGDDAAMVARRGSVLAAGHLDPLTDALVSLATAEPVDGAVVETGAGTAHHLAAVIDALPGRVGIALDTSTPALRRAARAHPRIAAVGADAWSHWPVADACAGLVLAVFAPRDAGEVARVLAPGGRLLVTSPGPDHLTGLVLPLGLLGIEAGKADRVAATMGVNLTPVGEHHAEWTTQLDREAALAVALMGPSGFHFDADAVRSRLLALPEPVEVTWSVRVQAFRRDTAHP